MIANRHCELHQTDFLLSSESHVLLMWSETLSAENATNGWEKKIEKRLLLSV